MQRSVVVTPTVGDIRRIAREEIAALLGPRVESALNDDGQRKNIRDAIVAIIRDAQREGQLRGRHGAE